MRIGGSVGGGARCGAVLRTDGPVGGLVPGRGHLERVPAHHGSARARVPRSDGRQRFPLTRAGSIGCVGIPGTGYAAGREVRLQRRQPLPRAPGTGRQPHRAVHDDVHLRRADTGHRLGVRAGRPRRGPGRGVGHRCQRGRRRRGRDRLVVRGDVQLRRRDRPAQVGHGHLDPDRQRRCPGHRRCSGLVRARHPAHQPDDVLHPPLRVARLPDLVRQPGPAHRRHGRGRVHGGHVPSGAEPS